MSLASRAHILRAKDSAPQRRAVERLLVLSGLP